MREGYATFIGTGLWTYVDGYDRLYGYASTGTDYATLYGGAAADTFRGYTTFATLTLNSGNFYAASGFTKVLAYDSGGVTTSTVTVPLVAALGLGLASNVPGRSAVLDGFGDAAVARGDRR